MSRAFVKEDDSEGPEPRYGLPDPESDYYPEACARALLEGANRGDRQSAERATGYRWGSPLLIDPIREIREQAQSVGDDRMTQLATRYLRAAGEKD